VAHSVDGDAIRAGDGRRGGDRMTDGEDRILAASEEQGREAEPGQQRQEIEIVRAEARAAM
jgi:hypothetical protein